MSDNSSSAQTRGSKTTAIVIAATLLFLGASIAVAAVRGSSTPTTKPSTAEKPAKSDPAVSVPTTNVAATPASGTVTPIPGSPKGGAKGAKTPQRVPGSPRVVAEQGSKLTTLTAPPEKTIGMIVVPKGFKGGSYEISFSPFGWGPAGPAGGRLVAQIATSKPLDAGAKALGKDFAGRNATLWAAPDIAKAIAKGGSYTGTMEVRPQGDVGVLYLVKVAAGKK